MNRNGFLWRAILAFALGLQTFSITEARACTTVALGSGSQRVIGKSFDWNIEDGSVFVNKRNVGKTALILSPGIRPASWTSKYGSVTFNQHGREFPLDGMNEAGLVVEIMWLDSTEYPAPKDKPALNELQWIQYQLDNYATVDEVTRHVSDLQIAKAYANVHYMACDKSGECATFEFVSGKPSIHSGSSLAVTALTNNLYEMSVKFLKMFKGFGGNKPIPVGTGSLQRFVRAAFMLKEFKSGSLEDASAYAFSILKSVEQPGFSQWNIVYNPGDSRIAFRTREHQSIKSLALSQLDFACGSPVKVFDMNTDDQGDINSKLTNYTEAANLKVVSEGLGRLANGLPPGAIQKIAAYPKSTRCL